MKFIDKLKGLYQNSPLLVKLNTIMLTITVLLCVSFTAFMVFFYHLTVSGRDEQSAKASVVRAASSFNQTAEDILQHFIRICSTKDFQAEVQSIIDKPDKVYMHRQNLQTVTNELARSHFLISSVLIVSGSEPHYAYIPFDSSLRIPFSDVFTENELSEIRQMTWCSERPEPSNPSNQVIPLVFPVESFHGTIRITGTEDSVPSAYVILFLDSDTLQSMLLNTGLKEQQLIFHLLRGDGTLISGMKGTASGQAFEQNEFLALSETLRQNGVSVITSQYGAHRLFLHKLGSSDLLLLCDYEKDTIWDVLSSILPSLVLVLTVILVLMLGTSYFMKHFVAAPVVRLHSIVEAIADDRYDSQAHFSTHDELGELLEAINTMYSTINTQKEQIKEKEALKYRMELKLMTEQINPHFLYNTLEVIQAEVNRKNNAAATSMIQSLADYLRISLSGGADVISISNELRHVSAYVNIMNQRFGQTILFLHKADPSLGNVKILKTILQPLVENSIRHGFGIDSPGIPVSVPTIEIVFAWLSAGLLQICVIDNGGGFDPEKLRSLMTSSRPDESQHHVGISNVYHRLITFYGEENVEIFMESIPYYQNSIEIRIHMP